MKRYSSLIKIISIFVFIVAFGGISLANQSGLNIPDQVTGDLVYDHVYYLSEEIREGLWAPQRGRCCS